MGKEVSMNFEAFVRDITDNKWNVFGTEVYKDTQLTHTWGDTSGLHEIFSATKSVLSVVVGIAYDEGMIDLNRSVVDYLPKQRTSKISDKQMELFKMITIERLLTMSVSGFDFRAEGDDWLEYALNSRIEPEKREFNYSNISTYLAGVCLEQATGCDTGEFIEKRLFKPLGIESYEYGRSPEGYFYGASAMKLSVHDLSKIGILLYNGGTFEGKRIVSKEYVDIATSIRQMNREGGYGYYIWKYRDGFSINGKCKQKCYILPNDGLVITYLSYIEDESHNLLRSMEKNILGIGSEE